jgi:predicted nucleotidyltransferase
MKAEILKAVEHLKVIYPEAQFIIFGSEANNTALVDSDLDLCVIFYELPKDVFDLAYDIRKIVRKYIDKAVDVIVLDKAVYQNRIKEEWTLEYEISKTGVAV